MVLTVPITILLSGSLFSRDLAEVFTMLVSSLLAAKMSNTLTELSPNLAITFFCSASVASNSSLLR